MSILTSIADGVKNLLSGKTNVQLTSSTKMSEIQVRQQLWRLVYQNKAPWLQAGRIYSANIGAFAAGEVARLVTLDMRISVEFDEELDKVFRREVLVDIRNQVEYGLAFGGVIIKPYMEGGRPHITFAQPNEYVIISTDTDGTILECYFKDYEKLQNGHEEYLVRVEHHILERSVGLYHIINEVYRSDITGTIGVLYTDTQAALNVIPRWRNIVIEQTFTNVYQPLFGHFKPGTSNTIDTKSPYGVSIFDKALQTIQLADEHLSGMIREFRIKEGRLYVDRLALENTKKSDNVIPHIDRDFYVKLDVDPKQGQTFFEVFSPEIRSEPFLKVYNKFQQLVEDNIGLMHGTLSAPDLTNRTATEVRESKHRTYSTVAANMDSLRSALNGALYAVAHYMNKPKEDIEVNAVFDESLLKDPQLTIASMRDDVTLGLIRPEVYLAKKYEISEEAALAMMPKQQKLRPSNTLLTWAGEPLGGNEYETEQRVSGRNIITSSRGS